MSAEPCSQITVIPRAYAKHDWLERRQVRQRILGPVLIASGEELKGESVDKKQFILAASQSGQMITYYGNLGMIDRTWYRGQNDLQLR